MDKRRKSKTFGLRTPTDLHGKLMYDVERLKAAKSPSEASYAAFDCTIGAWHLVDWTLHHETIDDATFTSLTGRRRDETKEERKKIGKPVETSFKEAQAQRLPVLKFCQMMANNLKHRELRYDDPMPETWSGSTARFQWDQTEDGKRSIAGFTLFTYVEHDGEKYEALGIFEDAAEQWREFLTEEGLYHPFPDRPEDD